MKIHDGKDEVAPKCPFKVEHHSLTKNKFNVPEKVNNINHWKLTDKVGDPEIKQGWKPSLKWSDIES
jgi:hypothetical protein